MDKLPFHSIMFGCDPEFFFSKDGRVIGAEKVLPEEGLVYKPGEFSRKDGAHTSITGESKIIIDGVQAELNPRANTCRANLGNEIACCFKKLEEHMKKDGKLSVDFRQTIQLDKSDMDVLSDKSKKFGCMPSKNAHDGGKMGKITVDPAIYNYRSAGGHLHLGVGQHNSLSQKLIKEVLGQPERLVNMLDILVGNTCVLIDRDPGNVERRKVYGRAGEFRTPPHGVEYRTLSNFWLRSYQLMSLVTGLARTAVLIVADNKDEAFVKLVNMHDVAKAINENDFGLALANFKKIEKLLLDLTPLHTEHFDLSSDTIKEFKYFVKMGLDHWFKTPPLEHWVNLPEGHNTGFGTFLETVVRDEMKKHG